MQHQLRERDFIRSIILLRDCKRQLNIGMQGLAAKMLQGFFMPSVSLQVIKG